MKRRGSTPDASRVARERKNPNGEIGHWSEFEEGGHFAAMEAPALLVGDVQKFFGPLR
jgi:epoxide hydrolase